MTSNQYAKMWKPETDNKIRPMEEQKNYNIQGNIRTSLRRDYKVKKIMKFLQEVKIFEQI